MHDLLFEVDASKFWGEAYDPAKTYPGPCDASLAYRKSFSYDRNGDGHVTVEHDDVNGDGFVNEGDVTEDDFQSCPSSLSFPLVAVACNRILDEGFVVDYIGEFRAVVPGVSSWNGRTLNGKWYTMVSEFSGTGDIDGITIWRECQSDSGVHGRNDSDASIYPSDTLDDVGFTHSAADSRTIGGTTLQLLAAGNYINYYRWAQTRLAAVQTALREVIADLPGETRLGVMRFDVKTGTEGSSDGGYMIKEFVKLGDATNRQDVIDRIFEIDPASNGGTPLGETLFEALQVFRGETVTFGADAQKWNIDKTRWPWDANTTTFDTVSSIAASRESGNPNKYDSPIIYECQKSAVIFLSDGDPDGDKNAWSHSYPHFNSLPNAAVYAPSDCDTDSAPSSCLREIAEYMANEDISALSGDQHVTTYTVGFGDDISLDSKALLEAAAQRGGGHFTMAILTKT